MEATAKACADDDQWCFRDAETWLVEEAGKRLGKPEMQDCRLAYGHTSAWNKITCVAMSIRAMSV